MGISKFHSQTLLKATKEQGWGGYIGSRLVAWFMWLQVGCDHSASTRQKVQVPGLDIPLADLCCVWVLHLSP